MKKTISLVLILALGPAMEVANADFTFGTPTNLGPTVNSSADDDQPDVSADTAWSCTLAPLGPAGMVIGTYG